MYLVAIWRMECQVHHLVAARIFYIPLSLNSDPFFFISCTQNIQSWVIAEKGAHSSSTTSGCVSKMLVSYHPISCHQK